MQTSHGHLSYCTNIHPGETWEEHFACIRNSVPQVKSVVCPDAPFGIGLRLSGKACRELSEEKNLLQFRDWLHNAGCYVFTMNGFPFGNFSVSPVKEDVHRPDWTTKARKQYTISMFTILEQLLPQDMEGSISTSPLSYRHWFTGEASRKKTFEKATGNILEVVSHLAAIYERSGKMLHLNPEPEPGGLLENTREFIEWYNEYYLPMGMIFFAKQGKVGSRVEEQLRKHVRLCYDVCHSALAYEQAGEVRSELNGHGISVGKVQVSSALKIDLTSQRTEKLVTLARFNEPVYLHQVVARDSGNRLHAFSDLPEAMHSLQKENFVECRVHFHVPVFSESYDLLSSTRDDILETISEPGLSSHWEVETYTWNILPEGLQIPLNDSISRELEWVLMNMKGSLT